MTEIPNPPANTTPNTQQEPQAPQEPPPPEKAPWLAALREWTTTVLAVVLLLTTVSLMFKTVAVDPTNFEQVKQVLLFALPLLGSVIGYYFGRVPAERRAETAETQANQAQQSAQAAQQETQQVQQDTAQKLEQVKVGVERAKAKMEVQSSAPMNSMRGGAASLDDSGQPTDGGAAAAYQELDAVSKML